MADMCGDNRFEIIERAKNDILQSTNINTSPEELEVLDSFLFRCWQMGWLKSYENNGITEMINQMIEEAVQKHLRKMLSGVIQ